MKGDPTLFPMDGKSDACRDGFHTACTGMAGEGVCACTCRHKFLRPQPGMVGRDHPATSHQAADRMALSIGRLHRLVVEALATQGDTGMTADEMEFGIGLRGSTLRPRLVELTDADRKRRCNPPLIERTERTRPTHTGTAHVYVVTDAGHAALAEWKKDPHAEP